MKDQIFISHATPEDNEFTIWLASRLEMFGYQVWIDKNGLLGGERFWATIQKAINASKKVLLVYSANIVKDGILKKGIEDEIEYAKSIASQKKYIDFVIPLHIDDSPYNLAIGLPNINHIPFNANWAEGLEQLKKKLDKDNIQYDENIESSLSKWYEKSYVTNCQIESKKEVYYSSWWTVKEIPQKFYMYQFSNREQAKAVHDVNSNIPTALLTNIISTFDSQLSFSILRENETIEVRPQHVFEFKLNDILLGFETDKFPNHKDVENHFKDLIRYLIYRILFRNGMRPTELSGKKKAYYYTSQKGRFPYITFDYPKPTRTKAKKKMLGGKYQDKHWHYGISLKTILSPYIGVSVKSHLFFSSDGCNIEENSAKQHIYRRNKGKNFFNEQWRDLFLALISSLRNDSGNIEIVVAKNGDKLIMKDCPEWYWSDYGYKDPMKKMDIDSVENNPIYEEEEENDN